MTDQLKTQSTEIKRLITVRINPGEDILLSLRQAAEENNIRSGIILNGLGSVSAYHFHVVDSNELPPAEVYPKADLPCDIVSMSGMIIDGRVHAHISLTHKERSFGGHVEKGCKALTFSVVVIAETPGAVYTDWDKIGPLAR